MNEDIIHAYPPTSLPCSQVMLWFTRLSGSLIDPDPPATLVSPSPLSLSRPPFPAAPAPPLPVALLGGMGLVLPALRKNCCKQ